MLEAMRGLKVDLDKLKAYNVKLMNAKLDQEEINECQIRSRRDESQS